MLAEVEANSAANERHELGSETEIKANDSRAETEAVQDALGLAAEGRHELAGDSDVPEIDLGPQGRYIGPIMD